MKFTKIAPSIQSVLQNLLKQYPLVEKIVDRISQENGSALLVGGAVRDLLLESDASTSSARTGSFYSAHPEEKSKISSREIIKDLDIEIHGLSVEKLQELLATFGPVSLVGKSFGVLRLHGLDIDWSLPRKDSSGRHPQVTIDPHMNFADAFKRRDLTINAMGIDLKTYELIDPWGGYQDLKAGILRATDAHFFIEDPLRLFRVMQFISRFQMQPDQSLNEICSKMSLAGISVERIESEFDKLFLKSTRPSLGIRWLKQIERLKEILPELYATIDVPQNPDWHPEGDVFEHTMQAIDAGALQTYANEKEMLMGMYGLLCHDLGKVTTTRMIDGVWRSLGHEDAGVEPAKKLLKRFTRRVELIDAVAKIVRHHMAPGLFVKNGAKPPAYKRLALKLAPEVTMELLTKVSLADKSGRNGQSDLPLNKPLPDIEEFLKRAQQLHVAYKPEEPIIQGRDIADFVKPGPEMGRLVKRAYEIQIDEGISDKQELIKRILDK